MDLNEVVLEHELTVNLADARLKSENSLISRYTQINDSVIQTNVLFNNSLLLLLFLGISFLGFFSFALSLTVLGSLVKDSSRSILDLEGKHGC